MDAKKLSLGLVALSAWSAAGAASAATAATTAGGPWAPKSDLFQLNYRAGTVLLLILAVGIAFGIWGTAMFRLQGPKLDPATGLVRRHTQGHRLTHGLNALGFVLATLTGAIMIKWIPLPMDKVLLYTVHYIGAGLILIGLVATVVQAATRGTTTVHRLIPRGSQIRAAWLELLGYAGLVGDRGILGFRAVQWPAEMRRSIEKALHYQGTGQDGKYLAAEEVLSYPLWALVGLLIVTTGILKAGRYAYPLPHAVVEWTTVIHDWAAVGSVVMLCVHVGALVLVRTNWPLFNSMATGTVSEKYVAEHHAEWYAQLIQEAEAGMEPAEKAVAASELATARKGK